MKMPPYIGITGVTQKRECKVIAHSFEKIRSEIDINYICMLGIAINSSTFQNSKVVGRYTTIERAKQLISIKYPSIAYSLHYSGYSDLNLIREVESILNKLSGGLTAIQLNNGFTPTKNTLKLKEKFSKIKIIIPIFEKKYYENQANVSGLRSHLQYIDGVLIDPSRGTGKNFELNKSVNLYNQIRNLSPDIAIGFSGGFSAENVGLRLKELRSLITEGFNIDSETKLRDQNDHLKISSAIKYIESAIKIFR